jgi:L-asparagine transporter-like permease
MNSTDQLVGQESWLRVRPNFLSGCAAVVAVLILPDAIARFRILEGVALLSAALAILVGWFLLLRESPPKRTWRSVTALITSVYLVSSLPVFLFELSPWRWFVRHPRHSWFSMYSMPWVHWGYIFMFLSVIGSFLGRGRSRIAFVTGSVLLMALREATGTWVF